MKLRSRRLTISGVVLAVVGGLAAVAVVDASNAQAAVSGFVQRCGIHFCVNGKTAYFAGANSYDLFTYGSGSGDTETQYMDKSAIDAQFANLAADGINLVRTWMFSHENWHGFEPSRGVMNEQEWAEFDYILYSASRHGIRVIPTFENYWSAYGGIGTILNWNGLSSGDPANGQFFDPSVCPGCLADYEFEVDYAINRVNHYTGVAYKDDPTIFSWELMNEPRHQNQTVNGDNTTGTVFRAWEDEVGAYIRGMDPNHMIDNGVEGQGSGYGYGSDNGVPYVYECQSPYIDFCSAHIYPTEYWANLSVSATQSLVARYIADAHNGAGKPMCLCEFNVDSNDRSTYWSAIYDTIEANNGDADAFWWYENSGKDGTYGVLHGDPVMSIFTAHSNVDKAKSGTISTVSPSPTRTASAGPSPTRSVSPSPSLSPTRTTSPSPTGTASACRVNYHLDDWGNSFNASVTIYNLGGTAINGWTLVFSFPGDQRVSNAWNANVTQNGRQVTATNPASYDITIPAGGNLNFGLSATSTPGTNGVPSSFLLNGSGCAVTSA